MRAVMPASCDSSSLARSLPRSRHGGRPPSRVKVVRPQAPPAGAPPGHAPADGGIGTCGGRGRCGCQPWSQRSPIPGCHGNRWRQSWPTSDVTTNAHNQAGLTRCSESCFDSARVRLPCKPAPRAICGRTVHSPGPSQRIFMRARRGDRVKVRAETVGLIRFGRQVA